MFAAVLSVFSIFPFVFFFWRRICAEHKSKAVLSLELGAIRACNIYTWKNLFSFSAKEENTFTAQLYNKQLHNSAPCDGFLQ